MKLYTAAQMRDADARAAAAGIPTARLMETAGKGVARELRSAFPQAGRVVVLCGRGNNGGDGYVAAAELAHGGLGVQVLELEGARSATGDAGEARARYVTAHGEPQLLSLGTLREALERGPTVVVDALFGTGLSRPLEGQLAELVTWLSGAAGPELTVVSVDVPSGLNADLARPIGPHVTAHLTVQLAGSKPASLFYPNRHAYGRSVLLDIGLPEAVLSGVSDVEVLDGASVGPYFQARQPDAHKYSAGTVCVVAGSPRYLGAAELVCRAAWRGGAGLVTLVAPARMAGAWPESIFLQHDLRSWPPEGLRAALAGSMVIGPGLEQGVLDTLDHMLAWAPGPVVLDAAALDPPVLAGALGPAHAPGRRASTVLTPHAGEAARLLAAGSPAENADLVARDPLEAARELARRYASVVVLKGPVTVIAEPGARLAVSTGGSPALATGGTGDVLAGLIGALAARPGGSGALFERTCLAVWLHGKAGELAGEALGDSVVASDVVLQLPHAFKLLPGQRHRW